MNLNVATNELIVSPKIFTIDSNKTQLIRIGMKHKAIPMIEKSFRLIIRELPLNAYNEKKNNKSSGVKISLNMSLPIFIAPPKAEPKPCDWILQKLNSEKLRLTCNNHGNIHLFMNDLAVLDFKSKPLLEKITSFQYVLPKNKKFWDVNLPDLSRGKLIRITYQLNHKKTITDVPIY